MNPQKIMIRQLFLPILLILLLVGLLVECDNGPLRPRGKATCPDHLSDEEMRTLPDTDAVVVDTAYVKWIKANNRPIRSLTSTCYSDLQFLKSVLGDRTLVQLGESGHGVAEFDAMKVRLIQFLHEQMDFDVIAFESSIFECYAANEIAATLSPLEMMYYSIFGVWHAYETLPLFEYIQQTQTTGRPLILAGFDIQISSFPGVEPRPRFLRDVVANIDSIYADFVLYFDSTLVAQYGLGFTQFKTFIDAAGDTYQDMYDSLVTFLDLHKDTLEAIYSHDPAIPLLARQTAWSMPSFIEMVKYIDQSNYIVYVRDEAMASNVDFLVDELFPGKKIIIWAHNFHIRHKQAEVIGEQYTKETMGTWIAERHRPYLYTVGLYMYRGRAAYNDRRTYPIRAPSINSIEAIFYQTRRKFCFVDMLHEQQNEGNEWMFQPKHAKTWGIFNLSMVLRDQYDGILFIDTVNPPDYVGGVGNLMVSKACER